MAVYSYPTSMELREIEQDKIPLLSLADDPIFQFFPIEEIEDWYVSWTQQDNYTGLQQVRGINGAFPRVSARGGKRFVMEPGVYGEYANLDERTLSERARYAGAFNEPIDIDDLVAVEQDNLLERRLSRIRWILWTLATSGTFSVADADGAILHTDSYTMQVFTAGIPWSTSATAVPLQNFRAARLLARGQSADLGRKATAFMNTITANRLFSNTNANDLFGWRLDNSTAMNNAGVNTILAGQNLPSIVEYDGGYRDDTNAFVPFIPDGKVVVFGARDSGASLGAYKMTRNANNERGAPGPYTEVLETKAPKSLQVVDGHNGGPAIYYPGSIVIMNV